METIQPTYVPISYDTLPSLVPLAQILNVKRVKNSLGATRGDVFVIGADNEDHEDGFLIARRFAMSALFNYFFQNKEEYLYIGAPRLTEVIQENGPSTLEYFFYEADLQNAITSLLNDGYMLSIIKDDIEYYKPSEKLVYFFAKSIEDKNLIKKI